jgi:N-acyl-D-amino-acid deacylase
MRTLLLAAVVVLPASSDGLRERLAERVKETLGKSRTSAAVVVARGDELLLHEAVGWSGAEHRPLDRDAVFCIGSITKLFTACAILKLEQQGRLSTDDAISDHLDGVPADKTAITIDQLLTHSAGLHEYHDLPGEGGDFAPISKEEALARILGQKLLFAPGSRSEYSNCGYTLLAAIVEEASGREFDDVVRAELFAPAGMAASGFFGDETWDDAIVARGRGGKTHDENAPDRWKVTWSLAGAGGIVSSPLDLWKFCRALEGGRILDGVRREKLFRAHVPLKQGGAEGYGWMVGRSPRGTPVCEVAGGDDFGFLALLRWKPEEREFAAIASCSSPPEGSLARAIDGAMALLAEMPAAPPAGEPCDVALRGGLILDGDGGAPYVGDVGIRGDRIVAVGPAEKAGVGPAKLEVDARGLAVAPGFVNMLSWATESLIVDGRSWSELRQGVTLEVMGEGESMGPLDESMKREMLEQQGDLKYDVTWTSLGQYLESLEKKGVACNVASLVGAATVRVHELGHADRAPTGEELARMQQLVRDAMEEGALGVGSALIYVPGSYATTDELVALCQAAAPYGGRYVSHLRSEGNRWLEAIDELIEIARRAKVGAEIWHFKAAGKENWGKVDAAVARIEAARKGGLDVTANLYPYVAGATGFDAAMPPWVQEGGYPAWQQRLKDPAIRARVAAEMTAPTDAWESLYRAAGGADRVICAGFKNDALKPLTGKTLAEIAAARGKSPEETAMDLVVEDGTRVSVIYFLMSEENVRREIALPWMAFCSDEKSCAPEGDFLKSNPHPRAYGSFARVLGKYARDEKAAPLPDVIRRLTSFPCDNLKIADRGRLAPGKLADVVLFDPATVADRATYERPHQLATGVKHVFVNGVQALKDGEPTGAKPGRFVRGPGWRPSASRQ